MFKKIISFFLVLIVSSFLISSIYNVSAATLTCSDSLNGKAILSEFSSASTTEWVELLNVDQDNSINLANCSLKDASNNTLKALTGTLPKGGFLTFSLDAGALADSGGLIRLTDASDTSLSAVSYGTDTSVTTITAPTSVQTGYYNLTLASWAIGDPTKGWCNLGTTGCPTIATIVSSMSGNGVKTNLADMSDYSRVSGLYFQKSESNDPDGNPIGKITFLSEMNFTDRDALSWMQSMDTNIDMSTKGRIGLNAELIKNLTSTNASLTMYGLTYSNPTISVTNTDGSAGDSSIVSGLSYSNGALTFTAAHFTTFTAGESSSGATSSSTTSTPGCDKQAPDHSPDLFQIDTTKNTAKLFFTPVNNAVDQYYIAYGFTEGDERFGVKFDKGYYDGVIDYTINELAPNTNYYFRVRAGNGCATGSWSNWMLAKTDGGFVQTIVNDSSALKTSSSIKEPAVEPTKTIGTPTLGVSDYVPPSQPVSQPTTKKSWWQKFIEYFKSTKP